jgi:putative ABC transport system permease protein
VEVLKGKLSASFGELWVRKGLVVFQFSISLLLIIAVAVIYRQMNFVQSKNLGYSKDNIVTFEKQGKLNQSLEAFLAETRNMPGIVGATSASENVANINSTSWGHTWEGQLPGSAEVEFTGLNVNFDFFETLDIRLKEGRVFSTGFGSEEATVILNEAAVKAMGLADPVGKWIELFNTKRKIVGVVRDFHFKSMYEKIKPIFVICNPKYTNTVIVKVQQGREQEALVALEALYKNYNPGVPFEFKFLDDEYQSLYVSEQRIAKLSSYFASIAILISCLGLFGLAAFTAERRTKEIGIRKILGSSDLMIVRLLSADFTRMIVTAIAIAIPTGYLLASDWLESFAYRIELEWWFFAVAGLSALVIACLTVGLQTWKAARVNPAECLRNE